jgi:hypothetical protein
VGETGVQGETGIQGIQGQTGPTYTFASSVLGTYVGSNTVSQYEVLKMLSNGNLDSIAVADTDLESHQLVIYVGAGSLTNGQSGLCIMNPGIIYVSGYSPGLNYGPVYINTVGGLVKLSNSKPTSGSVYFMGYRTANGFYYAPRYETYL